MAKSLLKHQHLLQHLLLHLLLLQHLLLMLLPHLLLLMPLHLLPHLPLHLLHLLSTKQYKPPFWQQKKPTYVGFFVYVRPARAHSCGCKSRRKLITANEVKRNCMRATECGEEAWSETASRWTRTG